MEDTVWNYLSNMDNTLIQELLEVLWNITLVMTGEGSSYCSENQSYYSDWSTIDTFYISNFVPQDFTPEIEVELSSLVCEEYTDINFNLEQGLNEPDIQSTQVTSNLGSIDLVNLVVGQNVGNASAVAGINDVINNQYDLIVSNVSMSQSSVEIDLVSNSQTEFSFTIINLDGGGIELSIVSPSDNNNYTSGNSLDILLSNIFINPSPSTLQFDVVILSELSDDTFNTFDFEIDCDVISILSHNRLYDLYPNPASNSIFINESGEKNVKFMNISGQLVQEYTTSKQKLI